MNRFNLCFGVFTLSASLTSAAEKPNVVIIVADDLGWGDVGFHGSHIRTPNIDKLAKSGINMTRFYTAPVSSPTRAGLLTGRYPSRFGIRKTVIPPWRDYGLDESEQTLADMMGQNEYTNRAALGKWHLGHARKVYYPLNRGFNYFYGCLNGAIDYFTHERDGELDWHKNWESCWDKGYSTDLITKEAIGCINRFSGKDPFFVYVAFNAPHSPFQAPQEEVNKLVSPEKFKTLTKSERNGFIYQAMVERLDKGVGEILAKLKQKGELENTVILFMSDNGGVAEIPTGSSCLPLRGHKFQEWDGGVRVPAIFYWEKGFKQGRTIDQVTGFVDIVPTLAQIAGATNEPPKPYDGISIYSVLKGEKSFIEREFYLGCGAAVNQNWKLILPGQNNKMKITGDYLINYAKDEYESKNSIQGNEKVAIRLKEFIQKYDTITPSIKEQPYDFGKDEFITPKEWKVSKP